MELVGYTGSPHYWPGYFMRFSNNKCDNFNHDILKLPEQNIAVQYNYDKV